MFIGLPGRGVVLAAGIAAEEAIGPTKPEMGDGILSSFHSALDAVNCALWVQQSLMGDPDLTIRIANVVVRAGDIFGGGVNIASWVEPLE